MDLTQWTDQDLVDQLTGTLLPTLGVIEAMRPDDIDPKVLAPTLRMAAAVYTEMAGRLEKD